MISDRDFLCSTLAKIDRFPVSFEIESFEERVSIKFDSGISLFDSRIQALSLLISSRGETAPTRNRGEAGTTAKSPLRITSGLLLHGATFHHSFSLKTQTSGVVL